MLDYYNSDPTEIGNFEKVSYLKIKTKNLDESFSKFF